MSMENRFELEREKSVDVGTILVWIFVYKEVHWHQLDKSTQHYWQGKLAAFDSDFVILFKAVMKSEG